MIRLGLMISRERADLSWYHPLGFGYIASYLRAEGLDVETFVARDIEALIERRPDVVGLSCSSLAYGRAISDAARARARLGVPVILGGVHATTCPESLDSVFTLAVLGEGERTAAELMRLLERTGGLHRDDIRSIAGLAWREGDELIRTPAREPIHPLDSIPPPDRDAIGYSGGPAHLMTSRGCPFRCSFCSSSAHWGIYRAFSAERVAQELDELVVRYGATEVHVYDDLFAADRVRLESIEREMGRRGLLGRVRLSCAVRANVADRGLAEALRRIGVVRLTFGAESCSEKVLRFLKGNVSPEQNQASVDAAHGAGIRVGLSFIVGVPGEDREDVLKTYRFIGSNMAERKIDQADVNLLIPMPGTEVWRIAKERGLVNERMDWDGLRRPWDGLVLEPSFLRHGLEYFRWDRTVRRMLGLFGRPVLGVAPFTVSARARAIDLAGSEELFNTLYLVTPEPRPAETLSPCFFDVVTCRIQDWAKDVRAAIKRGAGVMVIFSRDAARLLEDPALVKKMAWRSHMADLDLLIHDGIFAMSAEAVGRMIDLSPAGLADGIEAMDRTGLRVERFNPTREVDPFHAENLEPPPGSEATLSDLLTAYSNGFLERQRALNVESELRAEIAALKSRPGGGGIV